MTFVFIFLNSYLLSKKLKEFFEKGSLIISPFLYCVTVACDCYEWGREAAKDYILTSVMWIGYLNSFRNNA